MQMLAVCNAAAVIQCLYLNFCFGLPDLAIASLSVLLHYRQVLNALILLTPLSITGLLFAGPLYLLNIIISLSMRHAAFWKQGLCCCERVTVCCRSFGRKPALLFST